MDTHAAARADDEHVVARTHLRLGVAGVVGRRDRVSRDRRLEIGDAVGNGNEVALGQRDVLRVAAVAAVADIAAEVLAQRLAPAAAVAAMLAAAATADTRSTSRCRSATS